MSYLCAKADHFTGLNYLINFWKIWDTCKIWSVRKFKKWVNSYHSRYAKSNNKDTTWAATCSCILHKANKMFLKSFFFSIPVLEACGNNDRLPAVNSGPLLWRNTASNHFPPVSHHSSGSSLKSTYSFTKKLHAGCTATSMDNKPHVTLRHYYLCQP